MQVAFLFSLAVLVMSVVIHEVAHGAVAGALGDPTARLAGRLTLNPIKHIDPIGSIIVPAVLALIPGGIVFGWAKPVPYNPHNLRLAKWGPAIVAAAGPAANLLLALFFGLLIRFGLVGPVFGPAAAELVVTIVLMNLVLMFFNLIPVPPLDGSKIFFALLSYRWRWVEEWFNRYSLLLVLFIIFAASGFIMPLSFFLFRLITGLGI